MTRTAKSSFVKVVVLVLVLSSSLSAGNRKDSAEAYKEKNKVGTLLNGINSSNEGLRKSSIYFAGKYKVTEAVEALSAQLTKEKSASTRILIALSLYSIGTPECIEAVKNNAANDSDARVRRMCNEIYQTFKMNEVEAFYTVND